MSDIESAAFDDELLSAYLDDELAPEERARVEQRLAADPRAKQLLDELRAVSRTVKELPAATVGFDLRESVLRRAERAMLVPSERAPALGLSDVVRRIPFGRSKRAWVWAGLALAAGLMLMFFDWEPERNQGMSGVVAQRDHSTSSAETRSEPQSQGQVDVDNLAAEPPASPASSPASAPLAAKAADHGGGGVGGSTAASGGRAAGAGDNLERLVVYVNMTPEALRRRAFDAVLARNQIEVEQPALSDTDTTRFGERTSGVAKRRRAVARSRSGPDHVDAG